MITNIFCPLCEEQISLVKFTSHKENCVKTRFAARKEMLTMKYGPVLVNLFEKMLLGQAPSETSTEIIPGFLYVGNFAVAKEESWLAANKITYIINAASNECKYDIFFFFLIFLDLFQMLCIVVWELVTT